MSNVIEKINPAVFALPAVKELEDHQSLLWSATRHKNRDYHLLWNHTTGQLLAQLLENERHERDRERAQLQAQINDLKTDRDQWRQWQIDPAELFRCYPQNQSSTILKEAWLEGHPIHQDYADFLPDKFLAVSLCLECLFCASLLARFYWVIFS